METLATISTKITLIDILSYREPVSIGEAMTGYGGKLGEYIWQVDAETPDGIISKQFSSIGMHENTGWTSELRHQLPKTVGESVKFECDYVSHVPIFNNPKQEAERYLKLGIYRLTPNSNSQQTEVPPHIVIRRKTATSLNKE